MAKYYFFQLFYYTFVWTDFSKIFRSKLLSAFCKAVYSGNRQNAGLHLLKKTNKNQNKENTIKQQQHQKTKQTATTKKLFKKAFKKV